MSNRGKASATKPNEASASPVFLSKLRKLSARSLSVLSHRVQVYKANFIAKSLARKAEEDEKNRKKSRDEIRKENEALQLDRNRRTISQFLRIVGKNFGNDMYLSEDGIAHIIYKGSLTVVKVPDDIHRNRVYIYSTVCTVDGEVEKAAVMALAMKLNFMVDCTRGASLGFKDNQVVLCYTSLIANMAPHEFEQGLLIFLRHTCPMVRCRLTKAKEASLRDSNKF
jgi:hypothetical protein